jgi:MmyB-like transcription regulator ligand binding domain
VRLHRSGVKHFHHPVVGRVDLMFEAMALEADEGLTLTAYTAEPGTPSHDALRLLASWAATGRHEGSPGSRVASQGSQGSGPQP